MTVKFEDLEVGDTVILGENVYNQIEAHDGRVINDFEPGTPGIVTALYPEKLFPLIVVVRNREEGFYYELSEIEEIIGA